MTTVRKQPLTRRTVLGAGLASAGLLAMPVGPARAGQSR